MRIGAQHPAGNVPVHPSQLHDLPQTSLHTVCTLFLRAACAGRISNCKLKIFQTQYTQAQGAMKIKEATMKKPLDLAIKWLSNWSEWRDSNSRPLAPHASALPGCATFRRLELYTEIRHQRESNALICKSSSLTSSMPSALSGSAGRSSSISASK